jgi:fatty-acyl-CoA synthase
MLKTPIERRAGLERRYPHWEPRTLAQLLDVVAAANAERPLVITDERTFSYRDIRDWSVALAAGLLWAGIRAGEHVALLMANSPDYVAMKFAIARVGAVAVPINFRLLAGEIGYVLAQSDSVALITMARFRDRDYLTDLDQLAPDWQRGLFNLGRLRRVFVMEPNRPGVSSLDDLRIAGAAEAARSGQNAQSHPDPHAVSDILYTSGTTGGPKGVMLTHDMVLRTAYSSALTRAFQDGRRNLFAAPMYHAHGYVECLIATLFVGGAIIPQARFDAEGMLAAAERHHANEISGVPTLTIQLLRAARQRGFDATHLTQVFNTGGFNRSTIWQEIREVLHPREIVTAYGMTETTASTTCTLPEGPPERLLTTNGCLKCAGVAGADEADGVLARYKTIDPETGADLPLGQTGELLVRGAIVTRGYYNKPGETQAAFTADGWLHTGDLGRIDPEGYLTLQGRLKESFRCGGEMVLPREIEEVLETHPAVACAVVVGVPDALMGEVGCACVVLQTGSTPTPTDLIAFCQGRLARFKVPKYVLSMRAEEIPRTATGRPRKVPLAAVARKRLALSNPDTEGPTR